MRDATRAVTLAALLVVSVLAGTVAFAGGAAAVGTTAGTVTASPNTAGATAVHTANATVGSDLDTSSLNGFEIDYDENTGATDIGAVDESDVRNVSIVRANGSWVNVSDDLSAVDASNNNHTLTLGFGGSYSLYENDTVHVEYGDVRNPTSAGDYRVALNLNPQSQSSSATNVSFHVEPNPAALNVTVSPQSDSVVANHTVTASPGAETANTTLDNVTVAYDWAVENARWYGTPRAFVDTDGDARYDADETSLNATSLSASSGTVTVQFDGNYTLESGADVVLRYAAVNAESTGDHTVEVGFNGGPTTTDTVTITDGQDWGTAHVHAQPPSSDTNSTHLVHAHELDQSDVGDSLNKLEVDYAVGSAPADVSNVGQNDVQRVGILRNDTFVNVSDDLSSVSASNNGETLLFGFGGSYSLQQGDELVVEYTDVQNPNVSAPTETAVAVGVNVQSSDSPAYTQFHVTRDVLAATVVGYPGDAATNATQGVAVYPGATQDGQSLSEVTVSYEGIEHAFDGDLSNVTSSDVVHAATYDRGTERQTDTLSVTSVSGSASSVTISFDGSHTLSSSEIVSIAFSDMTAPTTTGTYWANVTLNGAASNYTDSRIYVTANTSITGASLTAADESADATTTHTVNATVAPGDADDVLTEVEVEYESGANTTNASVASLGIDRDGDGSVDETVAANQYTTDVENDEVDVYLSGETRVAAGDRVVLTLSGVTNPSSGESSATVEVNDAEVRASFAVSTQTDDANTGGAGWSGGSSGDSATNNDGSSDDSPTTTTSTTTAMSTETSTAESPTESGDATTTTTTSTSTQTTTTTGSSPGFGVLVALLAAAAAALLARRD